MCLCVHEQETEREDARTGEKERPYGGGRTRLYTYVRERDCTHVWEGALTALL